MTKKKKKCGYWEDLFLDFGGFSVGRKNAMQL